MLNDTFAKRTKYGILNILRHLLMCTNARIVNIPRTIGTPQERRKIGIDKNVNTARHISLTAVAHEINYRQISGHVAELGVFRGDFAKEINRAFPDKELYLFDTFEGFDQRDVAADRTNSYSGGTEDFGNTSVDLVLSKMPHSEKCHIVKGFFPDSPHSTGR